MLRPQTSPVTHVNGNFDIPTVPRPQTVPSRCRSVDGGALRQLRKTARDSRALLGKIFSRNPDILVHLRVEHNSIMREWSYKGVTFVPMSDRRTGPSKEHLKRITRASRDAIDLPPLFQEAPDMRNIKRQWKIHKSYKSEFNGLKQKLNENDAVSDEPGRTSNPHNTVKLDPDAAIVFCKEMLRLTNGSRDFTDIFKCMDADRDGAVSLLEFCTFLRSNKIRLRAEEMKALHQYLNGSCLGSIKQGTPSRSNDRTNELLMKLGVDAQVVGGKFEVDLSNISDAESYFRRQLINTFRGLNKYDKND